MASLINHHHDCVIFQDDLVGGVQALQCGHVILRSWLNKWQEAKNGPSADNEVTNITTTTIPLPTVDDSIDLTRDEQPLTLHVDKFQMFKSLISVKSTYVSYVNDKWKCEKEKISQSI